jgi:hypothetical protein
MARRFIFILVIAPMFVAVSAASAATSNRLQSLVNDTAAQIQIAYRQHPDEREIRQEQLAAVITAWRAAARSEANNKLLTTWLHAAIRNSMPGSHDPLPPAPTFAANAKVESRVVGRADVKKAAVDSSAKVESDPFRDDPATDNE